MYDSIPTIALVGRTNVGKSTLFNRLIEQQKAIVSSIAGTTRDRKEGWCTWLGKTVRLIDTGGLDVSPEFVIDAATIDQTHLALDEADLVFFVLDAKTGPLPQEYELAQELAQRDVPVMVIANKAERLSDQTGIHNPEWQFPGLPEATPVSAIKGMGLGDLLEDAYQLLTDLGKPPIPMEELPPEPIRVAVIGRPNVGKSSLLNAILGEDRFITSPISHTTREPNDILFEHDGTQYLFIDSAGIRKKGKVRKTGGLEAIGVKRTEHMLSRADVTLLVLDINEPISSQDRTLAGLLQEKRTGLIIVANKWDLIEDKTTTTMNRFRELVSGSIPFLRWAPVLFVSALNGQRVQTVFESIARAQENRHRQISNEEMDTFLQKAVRAHTPSKGKGPKTPTLLGMKQISTAPPTFELAMKARRLDVLHPSYLRYLENRLREQYDLEGTPIKIHVKGV